MKRRTADGRERDPGGPPRSRGALRDGATVVGPRGAVRTVTLDARGQYPAYPKASPYSQSLLVIMSL